MFCCGVCCGAVFGGRHLTGCWCCGAIIIMFAVMCYNTCANTFNYCFAYTPSLQHFVNMRQMVPYTIKTAKGQSDLVPAAIKNCCCPLLACICFLLCFHNTGSIRGGKTTTLSISVLLYFLGALC